MCAQSGRRHLSRVFEVGFFFSLLGSGLTGGLVIKNVYVSCAVEVWWVSLEITFLNISLNIYSTQLY